MTIVQLKKLEVNTLKKIEKLEKQKFELEYSYRKAIKSYFRSGDQVVYTHGAKEISGIVKEVTDYGTVFLISQSAINFNKKNPNVVFKKDESYPIEANRIIRNISLEKRLKKS